MCGNWLMTEFQDVFLGIIRHRTSSSTASASVRHSCQDQQTSSTYILHRWNFHMNLLGNSTRSKHAIIFICFLFFFFLLLPMSAVEALIWHDEKNPWHWFMALESVLHRSCYDFVIPLIAVSSLWLYLCILIWAWCFSGFLLYFSYMIVVAS